MKVCHVITGLTIGGAEMMLFKLIKHRRNPAIEYEVVSLIPGGVMAERIISEGIPVHSLNMRRGIPSPLDVGRLIRLGRRLSADVIQGWMYHGNLAALLMRDKTHSDVRVYWNIRHSLSDIAFEKRLTRQVIKLGARLSSRPDRILYNSTISACQHEKLGYDSSKHCVIPNGFDMEKFKPEPLASAEVRNRHQISTDAFLIGMIARYHPSKDYKTFLMAAKMHLSEYPQTEFLLAGQGVDWDNPELTRWIDDDVKSRMHLLGEKNHVEEIMNALDLFCLSSAWGDAFPNVIGEAMSCGIPCVSTDVGDARQIIGDTGEIVRIDSPGDLNRAWVKMRVSGPDGLRDYSLRARARIETNYRIEDIVRRYEALYYGNEETH